MNYKKIYESIIENARLQDRKKSEDLYLENHHIIPICLEGDDSDNNKVLLTFREHYICHKLLTYIYPDNRKLACAFHRMTYGNTGKDYNRSSRDYSYARELIIKTPISDETREKLRIKSSGKNNPMYGKPGVLLGKKLSKEHRRRQSESKIGEKNPQYGKPGFALGSKRNEESLKKLSISQKKRFKDKNNHPRYGVKLSEETKRKISESIKKKNEENSYIIRK